MEYVEIVEEYFGGRVIKRTVNGIDFPLSFEQSSTHFIHRVRMSRQDFERAYGSYPQLTA